MLNDITIDEIDVFYPLSFIKSYEALPMIIFDKKCEITDKDNAVINTILYESDNQKYSYIVRGHAIDNGGCYIYTFAIGY